MTRHTTSYAGMAPSRYGHRMSWTLTAKWLTVTCNVLLGPAVMQGRVSRACRQQCAGWPARALI
jgi:hypothetical protein